MKETDDPKMKIKIIGLTSLVGVTKPKNKSVVQLLSQGDDCPLVSKLASRQNVKGTVLMMQLQEEDSEAVIS